MKGPTLAHPPDPVPGWWPGPSDDPPPAAPLGTQAPRYGTGSLADLLPSVLAVLGVPGTVDALGLRRRLDGVRRVALLLVDGLGHHLLPLAARSAPTLADLATGRLGYATAITAGFPSTTPTSLVTVGTGAPPGPHGILGFTVNVPGTDLVLRHVDWDSDPAPRGWQPLDTRFEQARAAGVRTRVVALPEFEGSGLTRAAYGTVPYRPAADLDALATEMLGGLADGGRALVYGYVRDVDACGHVFGLGSKPWRHALEALDGLVARLVDGLPRDTALLITADHGQIDVPAASRFDLAELPALRDGVRVVAGEARVRYLHTQPGARDDVLAAWRGVLGDAAWVVTREEAVAAGWFGPVPEEHVGRVGDVVVACHDRYAVVDTGAWPREAALRALHGSYTEAEMMVPLILVVPGR